MARVEVTAPAGTTIPVGGTVQLTAQAYDGAGQLLGSVEFTWRSENELAATVDASGLVTGRGEGAAHITATAGGKTGGIDISVTQPQPPPEVDRVEIVATVSPSKRRLGEIGLAVEDVVSLMARGYDAENNPLLILHADWSAADNAATVTPQGLVHGLVPGDAIVGVSVQGKTDALTVHVAERRAAFPQVEPGVDFTCALAATGIVYCWGEGTFVGNGIDAPDFAEPMPVASAQRFTALASGSAAACALTAAGSRHCWGYDPEMSSAPGLPVLAPTAVANDLAPLVSVTLGDAHGCGLAADDTAYCWGSHEFGQVGDGTPPQGGNSRRPPTAVVGGLQFQALSAGNSHTCGLTLDGAVYCWGYNSYGRLGGSANDTESAPVKVTVAGERIFTSVSAGYGHTCALDASGAAWCWGWAGGFGGTAEIAGHVFREISAGVDYTCAIDTNDRAWCWGDSNSKGQQGTGDNVGHSMPTRLQDGNITWSSVRAKGLHTCGIASGTAFCWGAGASGQLGDGMRADHNTPTGVARQL